MLPTMKERNSYAVRAVPLTSRTPRVTLATAVQLLEAAFGSPPDLSLLLAASDEALRAAGMSRQKSGYIRSLAELVISGDLDLDNLPEDDEEAIALLTKIKGIGRWSAEIYLLFAEGRGLKITVLAIEDVTPR